MTTYTSTKAAVTGGQSPSVEPDCLCDTVSIRGEVDIPVAGLLLGDILEMVKLPAGCIPVDFIVDSDDMDANGAPTLAMSVGFTAGTAAEFRAAGALAQAAGIQRMDSNLVSRIAADKSVERVVGLKVTTAAATAAAGKVGFTLLYRAASFGE